jgi:4'-phosphopantetheinyl transferase
MDAPIDVWSCPLDVPDDVWRALTDGLAAGELEEGAQRRDELDRRRFLAARGWRRRVLAAQLGCHPTEVPLVVDGRGKPHLGKGGAGRLRVSAARSGAVCRVGGRWPIEVGVDVEAIDPPTEVFTPGEQRALEALAEADRRPALFACWARKEAYLKGTGEGLDVSTSTIEVWTGDDRPVTVAGWRVHSLAVGPGYAAAVAGSDPDDWLASGPRQPDDAVFPALRRDD